MRAWPSRRPGRTARSPRPPRPGRPVDRPVHSAAAKQRLVSGRDDGVHALLRDVAEHDLDSGHGLRMPPLQGAREVIYAHGGQH